MYAGGKEFILEDVCALSRDMLFWLYHKTVPEESRLSALFWLQYMEEQQVIGLHALLLLWLQSGLKYLPQEFQLNATMATMSGQDTLVDVGMGARKTLCMVLPCMLALETIAIIFFFHCSSDYKRFKCLFFLSIKLR